MNYSTIALSKNLFFISPNSHSEITEHHSCVGGDMINMMSPQIISIQAELMHYGYMLSEECILELIKFDNDTVCEYANCVSEFLKNAVGDGQFVSLFGDFPAKVMDMDDMTFYTNQFIHYLSDGCYSPLEEMGDEDISKYSNVIKDTYKIIELAGCDDMINLCKSICSANQSLTSYDKQVVEYYCMNWQELSNNITDVFPANIPFKETLCIVAANTSGYLCKNLTDVLRVAVYMSGGDISLAKPYNLQDSWASKNRMTTINYKFKKFSRKDRRHILSMIEYALSTYSTEDDAYGEMKAYLNRWIRLGEILHPGEYKNRYPNTFAAFSMIRDNAKYIKTFNGLINDYKQAGCCIAEIIDEYSKRPGEFARNIDCLIRKTPENSLQIIESFSKVVDKVSIKLIYELIEYYHKRNDNIFLENRFVYLKGRRAPIRIKSLEPLDESTRQEILSVLESSLKHRFSLKGNLSGFTYYIDERLKNIMLPKNMRSMNISLGQQARGTRIPIDAKNDILRLYLRWLDPKGCYDLDLSTYTYDENFNFKWNMSWRGSQKIYSDNGGLVAIFSGDVRHHVGNSAEYIDISIAAAKESGIRYIAGVANDYDGHGFKNKCSWCGVMSREHFGTPGETTWAPETIDLGFSINSECTNCVMTVIDLEKMEMIIVDEDFNGIPMPCAEASDVISLILKRSIAPHHLNALNVIQMNLESRNAIVKVCDKETICSQKDFIKQWNKTDKQLVETKISEIEYCLLSDLTYEDQIRYNNELSNFNNICKSLDKIKIISYDDISSDYTKLFEWMF